MTAADGFIVTCPADSAAALYWWQIANGEIVARGQDFIPPLPTEPDAEPARIMALLPAQDIAVRLLDMGDLAPAQAEAAARHRAAGMSIGGSVFVAARAVNDAPVASVADDSDVTGQPPDEPSAHVLTATIARERIAGRIESLVLRGLDPDSMVPVGLLLPGHIVSEDGVAMASAARFGDLDAIRLDALILPQDEHLVAALIGETPVHPLDQPARDSAMCAAFAVAPLEMRQGEYAKRRPSMTFDREKVRLLLALFGIVLILTIAIPLAEIAKLKWTADSVEATTLAEARRFAPQAADMPQAVQQIDAKLAAQGLGGAAPSIPLSALLSTMQPVGGTMVREINASGNGIVSAALAAPRTEDVNAVLLALQDQGYVVTAAPRSDATGMVVADITVRAP